jgi:hypothetical protein
MRNTPGVPVLDRAIRKKFEGDFLSKEPRILRFTEAKYESAL